MEEAGAFAPCHITGFFQILDEAASALNAGSRGAGVSFCQGVETQIKTRHSSRDLRVFINGVAANSAEVSEHVVDVFSSRFKEMDNLEIIVEHRVEVPLGAGFGTSGAAALSLALALNGALGLGLSRIEAAQLAHVAEVECKTGLGTVIAETLGGVEIRVKPGAPGIGEVKQMLVPKDTAVACLVFGPLSTRRLLSDSGTRKLVNELGGNLVDSLVKEPSIANFMELSRQFAEHVGLITGRVKDVLELTNGVGSVCSMPMFGESVFTLAQRESLDELLRIFHEHSSGGQVFVSNVDFLGARVLG